MLFNSTTYLIFLPVVFILYWFAFNKNYKQQNIMLMMASYIFYGWWDWRFVFLLAFSTFLDYWSGLKIAENENGRRRKFWLILSVGINLGFLGVFKYYNFFASSFAELLAGFGLQPHMATINVILPVGISFYTFHGLSYVFDIYNRRIPAEKNIVDYSLFVSYFPLLVAGPIERATHLLPQVQRPRIFDYGKAVDGLRQILWGLFKKVVIADQCAAFVNPVFNNYETYDGSTLAIAAVLFAFQIYGDFSGYSDIALGTSRLFGIELLRNFRYPYFSRDIAEFWRRWHISLSSWFKDYLYIPLGGSRGGNWMRIRNTFIIFLVSGFWHGANWTFIFWGFLNALFIMPSIILKTNRNNLEIVAGDRLIPSLKEAIQILMTFLLSVFCWIFFRANSMEAAFGIIGRIFMGVSSEKHSVPSLVLSVMIIAMLIMEWLGRQEDFPLRHWRLLKHSYVRFALYIAMFILILYFSGEDEQFIYFQF